MRSNRLRVFECATIAKIGGDAGRPKRVVANRGKDRPLRRGGGLGVRRQAWAISCFGQHLRCVAGWCETASPCVLSDASGIDVGAQHPGDGVMARYRMLLAAFLVQLNWPAGAFGPEILGLHARGRAHAREDVGEGGDERAVT